VIPRCARHVPFPTLQVQAVLCTNLSYFFSQLRDALFHGILHGDRLAERADACRVFLGPSSSAIGCLSPSSPPCLLAVGEIGGTIGAARIDVYDTFPYRPKNAVYHPRGNQVQPTVDTRSVKLMWSRTERRVRWRSGGRFGSFVLITFRRFTLRLANFYIPRWIKHHIRSPHVDHDLK
jgi:hypothetical protein